MMSIVYSAAGAAGCLLGLAILVVLVVLAAALWLSGRNC